MVDDVHEPGWVPDSDLASELADLSDDELVASLGKRRLRHP